MGTKTWKEYYETKERAMVELKDKKGVPGYSEIYWESGPREVKMVDGSTMWEIGFKMYYG